MEHRGRRAGDEVAGASAVGPGPPDHREHEEVAQGDDGIPWDKDEALEDETLENEAQEDVKPRRTTHLK